MPSGPAVPPLGEAPPVAPIDPRAVDRATRRLMRAALPSSSEGHWLAAAVARRMGERLALVRLQPAVAVDASGPLGASARVLREAYPHAAVHVCQPPDDPLRPVVPNPLARPWWAPWRRGPSDDGRPAGVVPLPHAAPWPAGVELVWSNLQLGTLADPPAELARWHAAVTPGGFVMFSALGPDTFRELDALYTEAGWGPPAHRQTDMHDYGDMLLRAGFADPVMDQERLRLTWADPEALLRDLRAIGANAHPRRFAGWRTPRWRARLVQALETLAGPDGRLCLTVEVAYGHAFRVERPSAGGTTARFSVEELRQTARTFQSPIAQGGSAAPDLS